MEGSKSTLKYLHIKDDILKKIQNSEYRANQVLPSENELCKIYNVSRITVRKALDELIHEDILYSIRGKGSFVKEKSTEGLTNIYSFTEAITFLGGIPSKEVISFEIETPDSITKEKMCLSDKDKVYVIKTLYLANNTPYCISKAVLSEKLFQNLGYFDLNKNSLYEILRNFYKLSHTRAKQILSATIGSEQINQALRLEEPKPLLKILGTSLGLINDEEVIFELYESYIITDILSYYTEK